jgi:hypothetical protein
LLTISALDVWLYQIAGSKGNGLLGPVVLCSFRAVHLLNLGTGETSEGVATIYGSH